MSNRIQSLALVMLAAPVMAFALAVTPVLADVIYDNGGADGTNGVLCGNYSSEHGYCEVADDFVLDPAFPLYDIDGAHFSYVWWNGGVHTDIVVQVSLYEDTGAAEPEMEPFWRTVVAAVGHATGDYYFDRPEVIYEAEWESVSVPSDTPFWVSFVPMDPPDRSYWLTSAAGYQNIFRAEAYLDFADLGYPRWSPTSAAYGEPYDLAFALRGVGIGVRISGYVRDADGVGVPDVLLEADNEGGSAATNSEGYYVLWVPDGWSGTVTPSKPGWSFEPPTRTYENVTEDQFDQDYTGASFTISGYVRDADHVGIEDVYLDADNEGGSASTNSEGYYELPVPGGWSGTVTPSKDYWSFEPPNRTYENVTEEQFDQDYTGLSVTISGYVRDVDEIGIPDVLLDADNEGGSATTNSEGYYELPVPPGWSGTVTPGKPGWSFEPPSRTYENVTEDQFDQDYTGAGPLISGYVRDVDEIGIPDVLLEADNQGGSATTNSEGYYELEVPGAWSGTVTPSKDSWWFEPYSRTYENVTEDQFDQDYTGEYGCVGDIDGDGDTDHGDLGAILGAWDSEPGDPHWNPNADIDGDGHVYHPDLAILLADWGCDINP